MLRNLWNVQVGIEVSIFRIYPKRKRTSTVIAFTTIRGTCFVHRRKKMEEKETKDKFVVER